MLRDRRKGFLLLLAGAIVASWYVVRFEGVPEPVDALLVASLQGAPAWESPPMLLQNVSEPAAIYLVSGLPGTDGLFEALRLELKSGVRSPTRIRIGPNTAYLAFDSAESTGIPAIEFRGLTLGRPTPHILRFPGPGGPGFHLVDSATGVMHIVADTGKGKRTLLTVTLINSSRMAEIRSHLWSDRARRLAAFFWMEGGLWTVYLFSLTPT
jgi:hypothetical protein